MPYENIEDFKAYIKNQRVENYPSSEERTARVFCDLGYDSKDKDYFCNCASAVIEDMRTHCWDAFLEDERVFTRDMLRALIDDNISHLSATDAIVNYIESYSEHIYALNLSNTQSRRSRAGKEFENILELVLAGAGVFCDSQGNIGKKHFEDKGLGKLVDLVTPGVVEYEINKTKTVLISAKTTLRERWQEVPEEMGRTAIREMYLATLDDSISANVLDTLYDSNVIVVTTKAIKENRYSNNPRILSFEELIQQCISTGTLWNDRDYTVELANKAVNSIVVQIEKVDNPYKQQSLQSRLDHYQRILDSLS